MNVAIRVVILTLVHVPACPGVTKVAIFPSLRISWGLCGHVRAGPTGVFRESMDRIRAEVTERLPMCAVDLIG